MKPISLPPTLLTFAFLLCFSFKTFGQCDYVKDSLALVQFHMDTNGDAWMDDTNWLVPGQAIGTWHGVTFNNTSGCVTEIVLIQNNLVGSIDALGGLSGLQKIILPNNIIGGFPASIGQLSELRELRLDNNPLQSSIPDLSQLSNLEILSLNHCQLSGTLPSGLGDLISIQKILLRENDNLTGGLPANMGNLVNLTELSLTGCDNFGGTLPPEMGSLTNLKILQLDGCQIGGSIPASFGNLTGIANLNLFNNLLEGCLPEELKNLCNTSAVVNISQNDGLDNDNWQLFCTTELGICPNCPPISAEFDSDNGTTKLCAGNDGQIAFVIDGGTPGYTVKYSAGASVFTETDYNSGDPIFVFPTASTTYTLLEVTDFEGCPASVSGQVFLVQVSSGNPPQPVITFETPDCFGKNDLILKSFGGNPVEWNWEGPDGFSFSGDSEAVIPDANELNSGDYFVTITDVFGCTGEDDVYVEIAPHPQVSILSVDFVCEGASLTLYADGYGNADDYSWKWTGPGFFENDPESIEIPASELQNGTYTVVITDDFTKCTASAFVEVSLVPPPIFANPMATAANSGQFNGSILFELWGNEPFSLMWQPGNGSQTNVSSGQALLENLKSGNYTLTVTDSDGFGCSGTFSFVIPENSMPCNLALNLPNVLPPACLGGSNGSISITVASGNGTLIWLWKGPNNFTSTIQNPQNLPSGDYFLTTTDANGCTTTATASIPDGTAPDFSVAPQNPANIGQSNATALLQINGGAVPFSAIWTGGGSQNSLPLGQIQISGLSANNYTCTLTDANGCTATTDFLISENAVNCTVAGGTVTAAPVQCFGGSDGSIAQNFVGGSAPFVFDWNFNPADGQQNPQNLPAGNYSCTISDADGCSVVQSATVGTPLQLAANSPAATAETCFGKSNGSILTNPTGGTPPLNFNWTSPGSFVSTDQNPQNLPTGNYSCTISDANGCTTTASATVAAGSPLPTVNISQPSGSELNCLFPNLDLTANSPSANIFEWSDGSKNSTLKISAAGSFSVTATDANSCIGTATAVVTANFSLPQISLAVPPPPQLTCSMPTVFLDGGSTTAGATFDWTGPGGFISSISDPEVVLPGKYFFKVFGPNGCSAIDSALVVKSADLPNLPNIQTPDGQFFDCKISSLTLVAGSVAAGAAIVWTGAGSGSGGIFEAWQPGIYVLKITAANGCTATASINLTEKKAVPKNLAVEICKGQTFDWAGQMLDTSGVFFDTLKTANGCDSLWLRLDLEVFEKPPVLLFRKICDGETFDFDGQMLDATGIFSKKYTSSTGCDSTVTLDLTVFENPKTSLSRKICDGEKFNFSGQMLDATGIFSKKHTSAAGCDSTVTLELTVNPNRSTTLGQTICEGETFDFAGQNLATAGIFKKQFQTVAGCDSTVTLTLQVNQKPTIVSAQDGAVLSIAETELTLPVLVNDSISKDIWGSLTILAPPASGTVERSGDTIFYQQTNLDFSGADVFSYQICGAGCPKICDTAQVFLKIANKKWKDLGDAIHNVLTPDGSSDGNYFDPVRDLRAENFEVERAELTIVNRWGDRVFYAETVGEIQPSWDGSFNENMPAAEGAYFFMLHTFAKNVRTTFKGTVNVLR